ncbi:CRISPR system precrRNA processing endoribonuclease RAMP protein Cas6 [Heliomicrobium modesticaldum]|uniref:CRISPR system precrRNA processing endoribonuclease RAMP protein Cas6 n=1 Tax=Heliomicrobium modesticaldum TaxID=35701 RepID=UPI0016505D34|nr:CRISPR system precrRNA processing endoribonuclease RAMP protein Cas6 [Heliomicrobium modesticaldum]
MFQKVCLVTILFQPVAPERQEGFFGRAQELPPPFVLRPLTGGKTEWRPGETFELAVHLFGKGCDYAPYLLSALSVAMEGGLGKGKRPAKMVRVFGENPFTGESVAVFVDNQWRMDGAPTLGGKDVDQRVRDVLQNFDGKVTMEYVTPLRLKSDSRLQHSVDPVLFVRSVLRRLSLLSMFHGQGRWEFPFQEYIEHSSGLAFCDEHYSWVDWERYSSRQESRLKLGGIIGSASLEGEVLPSFLPLILWAELTHVGKSTVFGLGKIWIKNKHVVR